MTKRSTTNRTVIRSGQSVPVDPNGNRESRRLAKKLGVKPRSKLADLAARMRSTDDEGEDHDST
jgi:hypothetical protein